jgi:hypothetical protein
VSVTCASWSNLSDIRDFLSGLIGECLKGDSKDLLPPLRLALNAFTGEDSTIAHFSKTDARPNSFEEDISHELRF